MYTGKDLIKWGFKPSKFFKEAIAVSNSLKEKGVDEDTIWETLKKMQPVEILHRTNSIPYSAFIEPENEVERENVGLVHQAMDKLMRIPTIEAGVIMPDACPAGVIPVGGVVAARNAIHPAYHSADVCCSMAISVFKRNTDPKEVLDLLEKLVHFGPTKRDKRPVNVSADLLKEMESNSFLKDLVDVAYYHFTTQGDGNHFYFVGHLESTGQLAIVSHHGSRGLGARLYKKGLAAAHRNTKAIAPRIEKSNSWLVADSIEGKDYWDALQLVRRWTKDNHFAIHNLVSKKLGNKIVDQFWNEHNFIFKKGDMYYHAKGATPSYSGFSEDDDGRCIIPMNMAEPILITNHTNNTDALGFAPHGAGRNMSRTRFLKEYEAKQPKDIDARFWCGIPDKSELPEAYKSAKQVVNMIEKHNLAKIVDRVLPYGSIMAGDWEQEAPWRKK